MRTGTGRVLPMQGGRPGQARRPAPLAGTPCERVCAAGIAASMVGAGAGASGAGITPRRSARNTSLTRRAVAAPT